MKTPIQMTVPCMTLEKYSELTGIPLGTVKDKAHGGEYPLLKTGLDPDKRERILINLVKLFEMADQAEFMHPRMNEA